MRVAFFCPTVSGTGGIESATRNLISGFQALGDQTHLFLFGGSFNEAWLNGLEYTAIASPQDSRLARMAKYLAGAVKAMAGWRPDVVICSDVTTIEMARLGRVLSGRRKTAIASWIHFPLAEVRMKDKLHHADLHLAISMQIAEDLQAFLPRQRERVFTIFNAVNTSDTFLVPRAATASFLYVGRLTYDDQKRVNDLLQAVALLRGEWKLKLIGTPPKGGESHGPRLRALATKLGLDDQIEWLGWQKDAWSAAGPTTTLVMPSDREGFPMVLIEAISHGIPCVSSNCKSGPSEIIEVGRNGWLFPVGDVRELALLLQGMVDQPAGLPHPDDVRLTAQRFSAEATAGRAKTAIARVLAHLAD